MDSSVYCLPADLLGEGADRVIGTVRDRAGASGVTVAACYHASRDIYPHNPAYRASRSRPGPSCCTAMTWTTAPPGCRRTASATVFPAASARPARPSATTCSP
ncbi:MAG TPA: hypothetical protein VGD83_25035 [Streptosporangiaceae bacterium]